MAGGVHPRRHREGLSERARAVILAGSGAVLPARLRGDAADFPACPGWTTKELAAHRTQMKQISELEERRLAYVAMTRAKHTLVVTGDWWGPTQKRLRGPSAYLQTVYAHCLEGEGDVAVWTPQPQDPDNPSLADGTSMAYDWPVELEAQALAARREAVTWSSPQATGPPQRSLRVSSSSRRSSAKRSAPGIEMCSPYLRKLDPSIARSTT